MGVVNVASRKACMPQGTVAGFVFMGKKGDNFIIWYFIFILVAIIWTMWGIVFDNNKEENDNHYYDAEEQYFYGDSEGDFYAP